MAEIILYNEKQKAYKIDSSKELNRGGEGSIIAIEEKTGFVAKIYHQHIAPPLEKQLHYLSCLNTKLFVTPFEILYDQNNNLKGYIMPFINGHEPFAALLNKTYCLRNNIDLKFKYKIAKQLIESVKEAHKHEFVIGDLNQFNVLFDKNADIKLIDTDSYQTPHNIHSGRLLEDIRDYMNHDTISKSTDYYSLAVLIFYLFTNTHPFKGIHKVYKKLQDRILNHIPIFADDTQLIVPKCYEPIHDNVLQAKFERLFYKGERFMLELQASQTITIKPIAKKVIDSKGISYQYLIKQTKIVNVYFTKEAGFVETNSEYILYSCTQKGFLTEKHRITKSNAETMFLCGDKFFYKKDESLFILNNKNKAEQIENIKFSNECKIQQYENILLVINEDGFFTIHLDEMVNRNLCCEWTRAYGLGFKKQTGLFQFAGGVFRIFYNTGKSLASVKLQMRIVDILQKGNYGIVKYLENEKVLTKLFKINGLNIEFASNNEEEMTHFDLFGNSGFIIKPSDNKILIIRTADWSTVSEIEINLISENSILFHTNSGILAWEDDDVILLNKK